LFTRPRHTVVTMLSTAGYRSDSTICCPAPEKTGGLGVDRRRNYSQMFLIIKDLGF
jgi:hypothetical protein